MISLVLIMRLISSTMSELTHTMCEEWSAKVDRRGFVYKRTLFANEGIVPVIGVVCISGRCASSIAQDSEVELCR